MSRLHGLLILVCGTFLAVPVSGGRAEDASIKERPFTDEDRAHWSFAPPKRPAVPAPAGPEARNPIDAFIGEGLAREGLEPAGEADRATLLRRLSFDLLGLPPTPEELEAFLADTSPLAYERQVDRMLASPHYGERWAQHWLDLARYADTDGYEFDHVRPDAWRYRDWVVGALNADMPYDRFVTLQLAGDEVAPGDHAAFIATGFNRCYPDMVDLNDQGLRRQNALNDITETTGLVFLGLTVGCARCHDHKYDPIRQTDFYRLQAFFTPARFRDDFPLVPEEEVKRHEERVRAHKAQVSAAEERLKAATEADRPRLEAELARLKRDAPPPLPQARGLDEAGPDAPPTRLLLRGDYGSPGPVVEPEVPAILAESNGTAARIVATASSSGRRSALAAWLTRPDHPLTARVIVNRLWQGHFGRGLVGTPSDFGTMGEEPTHPELLDWLAVELVEGGWSLKTLHRLIVTSAAYRRSSVASSAAREVDPDNLWLSHQNRRRLDGEALRDALIAVSGRLDRRMGGPGVFPPLPKELDLGGRMRGLWPVSPDPRDHVRRSLYIFVRRNLRYPLFEVFDRPDTNVSCPRRESTTIAPQALTLLNSELSQNCARALAERSLQECGPDRDARLVYLYRTTLARPPDEEERRLAVEFLGDPSEETWAQLGLVLLNLNEFIYID